MRVKAMKKWGVEKVKMKNQIFSMFEACAFYDLDLKTRRARLHHPKHEPLWHFYFPAPRQGERLRCQAVAVSYKPMQA